MSNIHLTCGIPLCKGNSEAESAPSIITRITLVALGLIVLIGGILLACGLFTPNRLAVPMGWGAVGGSLLLIFPVSFIQCKQNKKDMFSEHSSTKETGKSSNSPQHEIEIQEKVLKITQGFQKIIITGPDPRSIELMRLAILKKEEEIATLFSTDEDKATCFDLLKTLLLKELPNQGYQFKFITKNTY